MNREAFEQLVSAWLDEPQREDLKAALERAAAGSEELAHLLDQWRRLDQLIRAPALAPSRVDWQRLRERIVAAVRQGRTAGIPTGAELASGDDDGGVDRALAVLPGIEPRVDWERLRQRISQSVAAARSVRPVKRPRMIRLVGWPLAAGLGVAVAAAALLLTVLPRPMATDSGAGAPGVARVWVGGGSPLAPRGFATVRVHAPADTPVQAEPDRPPAAEMFLMIEPAPPPAALPAWLAYEAHLISR